jgi:ElaB/YqjD/DUF883 family membrane-anchored ribosome-binding protein
MTEGLRSEADRILGPVARAEAELKRAKEAYDRVCDEAAQRLRDVREAKVGDVCDGVLEQVKRHPGPSLIVAAVLGFFLGRLFRR